jgi:polyisoprenoid-binding protein YceI
MHLSGANASVRFAIRFLHLLTIRGTFGSIEGELHYDESNPSATSLIARALVESIATGNRLRDAHLRSSRWFDARRHAYIELRAVRAERAGSEMRVVCAVTIRGREAPVVMHCGTNGDDPRVLELVGRLSLARSPYGVGPPPYGVAPWDPRAYLVDDAVSVELRLRLAR